MIVKDVKTSELKPYGNNNRKHPKEQVDKLAKQIEAHGWDVPIVVDKDMCIIKGHARLKAAKKLKLKTVPVIVRDDLTPEQCAAARLADNKLSELAEIDMSAIQTELDALKAINFDLDLTAFDSWNPFAVDAEEGTEGLTDPDDVPELKPEPKSKLGDVWMLGNHRVMCGDSTDAASVAILMNGQKADLLHTDPPYGVDYEGVNNDHLKASKLREFIASALKNAFESLKDASNVYIWHADIHAYEFIGAMRDSGFVQAKPSTIQWVKDSLVLSQGDYHLRNEPCLYGWKQGSGRIRVKDRTQDTIWECPKPKKSDDHPTMKPIEICERAINNSSIARNLVLDLFLGSGSTLIACEKTGRHCYGMELSPQYVDVIIKRWQDFTGKKAIREDGTEFDHC